MGKCGCSDSEKVGVRSTKILSPIKKRERGKGSSSSTGAKRGGLNTHKITEWVDGKVR